MVSRRYSRRIKGKIANIPLNLYPNFHEIFDTILRCGPRNRTIFLQNLHSITFHETFQNQFIDCDRLKNIRFFVVHIKRVDLDHVFKYFRLACVQEHLL